MKKFTNFYDYGCLLLETPELSDRIAKIQSKLDNSKVQSLDKESHITILYGLHEIDGERVISELNLDQLPPLEYNVVGIDIFDNVDQNVLKLTIDSDDINHLNEKCREKFAYTTTYWQYSPHVTIAYMDKDWDGLEELKNESEILGPMMAQGKFVYGNRYNEKFSSTTDEQT